MKKKLVFIGGPTGVGKTELSLKLAHRIGGEILSMDSMQIYKGMDIGTDKIPKEKREGVPHHMLDLVRPGERFTAHDYQSLAYKKIDEIIARGNHPIFVGGTGLYLDAVIHDYQFAHFNIKSSLRKKLGEAYDRDGGESLYRKLQEVDPESGKIFRKNNRKRILRALEVYYASGKPISYWQKEEKRSSKFDSLIFILTDEREKLYEKINQRVIQMMDEGLVEENRRLFNEDMPRKSQAAMAIGYRQVQWYERGLVTREEMVRLIQQFSRNYAKRQISWFKRYPDAYVFNRSELTTEEILKEMLKRLEAFYNEPSF